MDRRLVVAYAAVWVALDAFALLPGNPDFSSAGGFVVSAALQGLLVWRLRRGSRAAWRLALAVAVLVPLSLVLMAAPLQTATVVLVVLALAQAAALLTTSGIRT